MLLLFFLFLHNTTQQQHHCLHLCCIASYSEAQTENAKSMSYQGLSQHGINEKFVCIRGRSAKQDGHDRQNAMSS